MNQNGGELIKKGKFLLIDFARAGVLAGSLRQILESCLGQNTQIQQESVMDCGSAFCENDLSSIVSQFNPDVIFFVLTLTILNYAISHFRSMKREVSELPIIAVVESGEPDKIFELLKLGLDDFITTPLKAIDIIPRLRRLLEHTRRQNKLVQELKERLGLKQLVGENPSFLAEIKKIPIIAKCDAGVMILGETGTGKELCARAIHYLSPRASRPFIPVNCGAIPVELVENELFGHERGAFTGASSSQSGLIHEADGGTLFLDEIDCLAPLAQTKLLRFLQEKEYRPLGSKTMQKADVRVIAATNIDLAVVMKEGTFRRDLYYRLNIIPFRLVPLRERREDIPALACHFLAKYAAKYNKQAVNFSQDSLQMLMLYDWPGNIRELEHIIERAVVLSERAIIQGADIDLPGLEASVSQESFKDAKQKTITQFESAYVQRLLLIYEGNVTKAAHAANKDQRTFWRMIRKYGLIV